jgi:ribosomal silencing factor RsfS
MKFSICRFFARKVSKAIQFQPKITKLYDEFVGMENLQNEERNDDTSGKFHGSSEKQSFDETVEYSHEEFADSVQNKENPASNRIRDVSNSKTAVSVIDPEAMHFLGIEEKQFRRKEQELLERQDFIKNELLDEQFKPKAQKHVRGVLKRLDKNFRWGLAGEILKRKKQPFTNGETPSVDELKSFLDKELLKDITIIDMATCDRLDLGDYGIIATGYSNRHIYKVAKTLVKEMDKLDLSLPNPPKVLGRKDDEWVMVSIGPRISIHLFTENMRQDINLEEKWRNMEIRDLDDDYLEQIEKKKKEIENPFKFRNIN